MWTVHEMPTFPHWHTLYTVDVGASGQSPRGIVISHPLPEMDQDEHCGDGYCPLTDGINICLSTSSLPPTQVQFLPSVRSLVPPPVLSQVSH